MGGWLLYSTQEPFLSSAPDTPTDRKEALHLIGMTTEGLREAVTLQVRVG